MEYQGILMEKTEKHFFREEDYAERFIESSKEGEHDLIDYKLSRKDTKEGEYFIVTLKKRFATLPEAKEQL